MWFNAVVARSRLPAWRKWLATCKVSQGGGNQDWPFGFSCWNHNACVRGMNIQIRSFTPHTIVIQAHGSEWLYMILMPRTYTLWFKQFQQWVYLDSLHLARPCRLLTICIRLADLKLQMLLWNACSAITHSWLTIGGGHSSTCKTGTTTQDGLKIECTVLMSVVWCSYMY
jgi:hypothetical protein